MLLSSQGTQKMEKAQRKLQQDYSYDYTASTRKLAIPTPLAFFPLQGEYCSQRSGPVEKLDTLLRG